MDDEVNARLWDRLGHDRARCEYSAELARLGMFVLESSTLPNSPGIRASACADLRCLRRLRLWRLMRVFYRLCFV